MALKFQPKPRMVLICDFRGFETPEMVKRRPVVVLASNAANDRLVTIVPLSTTVPRPRLAWHHALRERVWPLSAGRILWAKCDLLYTVSTARLDKIRVAPGRFAVMRIGNDDYMAIRKAVLVGLGMGPTGDPEP